MAYLGTSDMRKITAIVMAIGGLACFFWTREFITKILAFGVKDMPLVSVGTPVAALLFWSAYKVYKGII